MSLCNIAANPQSYSKVVPIKELSLSGILNTPKGAMILDIYNYIISNYDDCDTPLEIANNVKLLLLQKPLSPIDSPVYTGEYINHGNGTLQSTRLSSVFSHDGGATWYDIDRKSKHANLITTILSWIPAYFQNIRKKLYAKRLYYISFPYDFKS